MKEMSNPLGNIYVSQRAIATIAAQSAIGCYGVVGLAAKNLADEVAQTLVKDPTKGVELHFDGRSIGIDLYLIIEYGMRITTVASSVVDTVRYQIEKATSLPVKYVNVHVRGLRISDTD